MKESELIDYVKRQLGYPTVNVELTDEQIKDAIVNAIQEIQPWYTVFKYITLDAISSCIDLTEYKVKDVTDVIKVFDASTLNGKGSKSEIDPFSYSGMAAYYSVPFYAISRYSTSIMTNQNIHRVISSYASMYQEQFYAKLATAMEQRAAGSLYENISWKFYDNKLYIDTGVPSTTVITIEYIPNVITVEDFPDNEIYTSYLRNLSVDFSLILQARVVGKYQVSGSPTTINFSDMRADAQRDIDRIREDLINKVSNRFYITD